MKKRNVDGLDPERRRELVNEYRAVLRRYRKIIADLEQTVTSDRDTAMHWLEYLALALVALVAIGGVVAWLLH